MVRINLTWILAAMVVVTLGLLMAAHGAKERALEVHAAYQNTKNQADRIAQLRREWESNSQARNRIERLLASSRYKEAGSVVKNQEGTRANLQGLDAAAVNNLMRPLLQSPVVLTRLQIDRQDESHVDLTLEIAP